jgi:hypothetical protein
MPAMLNIRSWNDHASIGAGSSVRAAAFAGAFPAMPWTTVVALALGSPIGSGYNARL